MAEIEKATGYDFLRNVPEGVKRAVEGRVARAAGASPEGAQPKGSVIT